MFMFKLVYSSIGGIGNNQVEELKVLINFTIFEILINVIRFNISISLNCCHCRVSDY